jgi:hypothetical protein
MAIQNTDEPSSDRLIQEGRPHMRRLSFFFDIGTPHLRPNWAPSPDARFSRGFLHKSRYWQRKHRIDMLVDSQRWFDYFVFEFGLENP